MTDRTKTRQIRVGGLAIGGGAAIPVQSMCNTPAHDAAATLEQIRALAAAGCDLVRLAVPDMQAVQVFGRVREESPLPLVADIHFDYKLALGAIDAGADKIRINPGNIGGQERVRIVAEACKKRGLPIRIGVNGGSLEKNLLAQYGNTPRALVESALGHIRLLEQEEFYDICVSIKSSDVQKTAAAYALLAQEVDYPLHLGITETGTPYMGLVKSAAGIGGMLLTGIGDTLRVSLTADPVEEVRAGIAILKAVGLRKEGVNIVSCPTCGRTQIDLIPMASQVEALLADIKTPLDVAVMGCVVNGPGEAREADYGLAGGKGQGVLFRRGEIVGKVPEADLAQALSALIHTDLREKGGAHEPA